MLKPGMFINDRYEIIEKVGSGGMADVYKARCHRLNRFVAIKVLKAEYSNDTTFVLKFRAEAQSAAGLSHPNIVNVYDVGDDDGLYYIVMELVEGITLKSFIERKGKLEVKEAVGIAIQIASGLEAAHDNHIIHRDIKPQNIIISREGKVKVTDFGIAKAATSNTISSNAMGSVHYISPEQARGGYSDEKSDIYSLGVTLYEMLSGHVPFAGDNTVSVALLHIQGEAKPLREINPEIPISLERIVQKAMEKKPERRYLSAAEMIADLKRSIINPNGDFVKVASPIVDDSPTINISEEEVNEIKNASKAAPAAAVAGVVEREEHNKSEDALEDDFAEYAEDEDESDVDPKLDKIFFIGGIALAVVLGVVVLAIIGNMIGLFGGSSTKKDPTASPSIGVSATEDPTLSPTASPVTTVEMPEVVGRTSTEAKKILDALNIKYTYTEQSDDTIQKDYIISQSIDAGTEITLDETVKLVISTGSESFPIADVTGYTLDQAHTVLGDDQGLSYTHEYVFDDEIEKDHVVGTKPEIGTAVNKGDKIVIVVSKGAEVKYTKVPDVQGKTQADAKETLEKNNLTLGKVTKSYSSDVPEGLVIAQDTKEGEKVVYDTAVNITISKGPEPTATPTATPKPTYTRTVTVNKTEIFKKYVVDGVVSDDAAGDVYVYIEFSDGSTEDIIPKEYFTLDKFSTKFGNELSQSVTTTIPGRAYLKVYLDGELQVTGSFNFN